jgi:hypothetical protein
LGVPPEDIIAALDAVATLSGNVHEDPSWHHYSIRQRIDFVKSAIDDPNVVTRHHRRVRFYSFIYTFLLFIMTFLLFSPAYKNVKGLSEIHTYIEYAKDEIREQTTVSLRKELAQSLMRGYNLAGDEAVIENALTESLAYYAADTVDGVLEFYTSQKLLEEGQFAASAILMTEAWEDFDFNRAKKDVREDFLFVTVQILEALTYAKEEDSKEFIHLYRALKTHFLGEDLDN